MGNACIPGTRANPDLDVIQHQREVEKDNHDVLLWTASIIDEPHDNDTVVCSIFGRVM